MHVAVVGAGALGRVFGTRLAVCAGLGVTFVVREARLGDGPIAIQRVDSGDALVVETPVRTAVVPARADLVLLCVGSAQVDRPLFDLLLAGPPAPIVAFTPLLPKTYARARAALGERLLPAMSSVTGYVGESGVTRYWLSRSTKTVIDAPDAADAAVSGLIAALGRAEIDARVQPGMEDTSAATAMIFVPLAMGIAAAGSIDALLADRPLLATTFRAWDEAKALAARTGKLAPWTSLVTRFLGPATIRFSARIGKARAPEALRFVEEHFGRRARAQNAALGAEMVALADEKGLPAEALGALLARLSG